MILVLIGVALGSVGVTLAFCWLWLEHEPTPAFDPSKKMRPVAANPADSLDEADFDVDGGYGEDGTGVRAFLILEGDFVSTCEAYLADPNASGITLRVERSVAEELVEKITPYLWP